MPPTIFVSCGQFTAEEKALGKSICEIIRRAGYEPYFAENQNSLRGLHENILTQLHNCAGFIAVMHPRGIVSFPGGSSHTRGSVWIEQEIAIAAFVTQFSGRNIKVAAFIHDSIKREGIRDLLHLNPIAFKNDKEILDGLPTLLRNWKLVGTAQVELLLSYDKVKITGERHDYQLVVAVKNLGNTRLTEYQIDLFFPDAFLNPTIHYGHEVSARRTETHRMFRLSEKEHLNEPIYPGDTKRVFTLPYLVNRQNWDSKAIDEKITATLRSGDESPLSKNA